MKFEEVVVGVTYVVSIPKRLPSPTFEAVTGEVEGTMFGIPLGHQVFAGGRPGRDSEKAEVLAKEKPWVLVRFVTRRARHLPENVGIGFETDENGDLVYDEITHLAKVKATRIGDDAGAAGDAPGRALVRDAPRETAPRSRRTSASCRPTRRRPSGRSANETAAAHGRVPRRLGTRSRSSFGWRATWGRRSGERRESERTAGSDRVGRVPAQGPDRHRWRSRSPKSVRLPTSSPDVDYSCDPLNSGGKPDRIARER